MKGWQAPLAMLTKTIAIGFPLPLMNDASVIRSAADISISWLSEVLGQAVSSVGVRPGFGHCSSQFLLKAKLQTGSSCALRLKLCLGTTFGRSEVDYYRTDYVDMADAPLVRCVDAQYEQGVGYHILLEDLAATHHDRRNVVPTLDYGKAAARALGAMHRHHWQSRPAPDERTLLRYIDEARPGWVAAEQLAGCKLRDLMKRHEDRFLRRWSSPRGMSLLHGDLNATNVLTPKTAEYPVYFLDRQPFEWSLTYGVAVHDLAYFLVLWWPSDVRRDCEHEVLRHWYEAIDMPDYTWHEARADWALSVEQCMNVPLAWCSTEQTLTSMRWLWEVQLARVQEALDPRHERSDA
jgi:hypothetical protein